MSTQKPKHPHHETANKPQGVRHASVPKSSSSAAKSSAVKRSARDAALDVLIRVEEDQSYSNLLLNQTLQKHALERADVGLATELVYGTIGRKNTIDFFLERFVSKGLGKLEPWVRCLLRLSFYQMHYLDRIPDHAVVSEAVNIAKRRGHQGISGMVNGVLRAIIRSKAELTLPDAFGDVKRIAFGHSHPEWLVRRWIRQLGPELTEQICAANNVPPHVSIRANTRRGTRLQLLEQLQASGFSAEASELAQAGILVHGAGNMALVPGFQQGDFSIQDESSMLVAEALDPRPGMKVLDCCAAPGGKTAHIAEKMGDVGTIWACDLHEHKQKLIADQAERLGLSSIQTLVMDAVKLTEHFAAESFDRILLDAPCSGLGVIRRKPDLKWAKQEDEIEEISKLQAAILGNVHRLLKPGGVLVYSTCTIEHAENEGMIERFLADHNEFELTALPEEAFASIDPQMAASGMVQILPQHFHSDGFFIARLRKRS
ncbi:16S rRNA (cytosine(967)-C(5))-methyltransferase RsmB [Paenibacillus sp. SYP-B3998]|uniref:16S rRNA (cytosine(967)-C(5))-methyltransferase n=1 Tax=Paenibacillus sp. SYP-B3998 TaxID=2678564 RepID=A0A6G3ZTD4_9BACL|nr:16S rRNA (cytosine(967)-C(5))-methyltransferase RsmB [Paenibacillus sp. SYP-B3998]NEW05463.1 16S rRNA (cytosine(967)-C(5))-methyltransferase RsmB [Paenibacillus sp. SYP-B3998]